MHATVRWQSRGTMESNASDASRMCSARRTVCMLTMHPPAQSSVLLPWIRQQAAALSPQGGAVRVLEVGAGDGRLAHFCAEALEGPVASGDGSVHAAGGTTRASFDSCRNTINGCCADVTANAPGLAAAPQILVSASDDGSLGLHVSSPHRSAPMAVVLLHTQLPQAQESGALARLQARCGGCIALQCWCCIAGFVALTMEVVGSWSRRRSRMTVCCRAELCCGCRHLVALEGAEAAVARVQPHIVLVRTC